MSASRSGRAIALEGAVIVLSILLAFAVDAAWEARRDADAERLALAPVLAEIDLNLTRLGLTREHNLAVLADVERLMRYDGRDPAELDRDTVDVLLESLTWWGAGTEWTRGAWDALVTGGNLDAIEDTSLRVVLTALGRVFDETRAVQSINDQWVRGTLLEVFRDDVHMLQVSASSDSRPGYAEPVATEPFPWEGADRDHRPLVVTRRYQNLFLEKWWIVSDVLKVLDDLSSELTAARSAICRAHVRLDGCGSAPSNGDSL